MASADERLAAPGRRIRRRVGLAALTAALLAPAACSGGTDEPDPTPSGSATTAAAPESFCTGALPGSAVVALLGPGRIRESGVPQIPRPGQLNSQCALRSSDQQTTLTLATSAAEVSGRVTLQGIANNNPATAVPIAPGATGLVDPGLAWLARPCAERRTLLATLRLTPGTGGDSGAAAAGDPRQLAALLMTGSDRAAAAARCDRGSTPTPTAIPAAPAPAPVTSTACGAPAAVYTPITGPLTGWTTTAPAAPADAPARTCELAGPNGAHLRFVVSRGLVAANAGALPPGTDTPSADLPGATVGPTGARLDSTCRGTPVAYRLRLNNRPAGAAQVDALFTTLVRAAATSANCPVR